MQATPEGRRRFSLKEWKKDRQGCIFLCSEPETQEAILPLYPAIADMAIFPTSKRKFTDRDVPRGLVCLVQSRHNKAHRPTRKRYDEATRVR